MLNFLLLFVHVLISIYYTFPCHYVIQNTVNTLLTAYWRRQHKPKCFSHVFILYLQITPTWTWEEEPQHAQKVSSRFSRNFQLTESCIKNLSDKQTDFAAGKGYKDYKIWLPRRVFILKEMIEAYLKQSIQKLS